MARFAMFNGGGQLPTQEFEGDYMTQNGEYVMIFKEIKDAPDRQVDAICLDKNRVVREM